MPDLSVNELTLHEFVENLPKDREVKLVSSPYLPRVEKFYENRESMLDKQAQNVLLCLISRKKSHPRLKMTRNIEFIQGEYEGKMYVFASESMFNDLVRFTEDRQ